MLNFIEIYPQDVNKNEIKTINCTKNGGYTFDPISILMRSDIAFERFIKDNVYTDADEEFLRKNRDNLSEIIKNRDVFNTNNLASMLCFIIKQLNEYKDPNKQEILLFPEIRNLTNNDAEASNIILDDDIAGKIAADFLYEKYSQIKEKNDEHFRTVIFSNYVIIEIVNKQTKEPTPYKAKTTWELIKETKSAFVVGLLVFVILKTLIMNCMVPTGSMENTIPTGSFMIANRIAYIASTPKRGDIVVFKNKDVAEEYLTKRVIGVGGDKIEIKDNKVFVNGKELPEPYVNGQTFPNEITEYNVPEGKLFLIGDNRENSLDSRYWNNPYLDKESVVAKAVFGYGIPFVSGEWFIRALN